MPRSLSLIALLLGAAPLAGQSCLAAGEPLARVATGLRGMDPLFQQNGVEFRSGPPAGDESRMRLSVANHSSQPVEVAFTLVFAGGSTPGEVNLGRRCVRLEPGTAIVGGDSVWSFPVQDGAPAAIRIRHLSVANLQGAPAPAAPAPAAPGPAAPGPAAPGPAATERGVDAAPGERSGPPATERPAGEPSGVASQHPAALAGPAAPRVPGPRSDDADTEFDIADELWGDRPGPVSPLDVVLRIVGGVVLVGAALLLLPPVAAALWLLLLLPAAILRRRDASPPTP